MNGNRKGSQFEREICKQLSLWWSRNTRDDIFWRSSQSGGRATQRAKTGRKTFGSYGDITAVDPIGAPLIKAFTLELKAGKSHGSPGDLIDLPKSAAQRPFEATLEQVRRSALEAGSYSWLIISRRDRRTVMVYGSSFMLRRLLRESDHHYLGVVTLPRMQFRLGFLPLSVFLRVVAPEDVQKIRQ